MKRITNVDELKERILELEIAKMSEKQELKMRLHELSESLRPANLARKAVREVATNSNVRGKVLGAILGLAAGFIVKKFVFKSSNSPLKRIAGNLIQMGIAGAVSKNSDSMQSFGATVLQKLFNRSQSDGHVLDNTDHL